MGVRNSRRAVACMLLMVMFANAQNQTAVAANSDSSCCSVSRLEARLTSIERRLNGIQLSIASLNDPLPSETESCTVDLASYGHDDSPKFGYVKTSGGSSEDVLVLNKFGDHMSLQLGVTILELDPKTCTTRNRQRFDTWASQDERVRLLASLELKTTGTIIVGVTVDSAERSGEFQNTVRSFFDSYNMNLSGLRVRDKFAFIIQIGYPKKTIFQIRPRYGASLKMKMLLSGSTVSDVTFKEV